MPPGQQGGPRLPVDFFFRSLAADQGARAIGVILSGTGTDGTLGLKAIKEAGGITFAQDPATAKYDGMPRSAIDSGCVDVILPPESIADQLMSIGAHPYLVHAQKVAAPGASQESIAKLLLLIRASFGHDLTYHKPSTIERRIERRLALHKIEKLSEYVKFVQSSPDELRALYKDILISVTSFFRDGEPFDVLANKIFPQIIAHKKAGSTIRAWIPACSTGEEAYSIAICLLEALGDRASDYRLQLFGTDIDDDSIQFARRGCYPQNIALDVSKERLSRFFVKRDAEYQIARRARDMVVFSTHNLTKDAPFSKLDLVSCRNLLIYLQTAMQKRVLKILHYALNPNGFLMLGTSETVGDAPDLFSLVDRKNKIYSAKHVASTAAYEVGFNVAHDTPPPIQPWAGMRPLVNLASLADKKILEIFGPPGVVINENLEILHFRGRTGPFLEPAPGTASLNILRLARPELHIDLRRTVQRAMTENARVTAECRLNEGKKVRPFKLEVVPILDPDTKTRCLIVLFHEPEPARDAQPARDNPGSQEASSARVQEVERELTLTKEYLQSTIEELESANEELKSSNEELQSSNEELQSTNEELETSKEELQSANEELTTVNDELQQRMSEQQQTSDDLHNILSGVEEAVIIAGLDMRIRRFTHAAEKMMNLVPGDVGRTITQLNTMLGGVRVEELAHGVIESLIPVNRHVQAADGRTYALRISPYKTLEHSISGVVIALTLVQTKASSNLAQELAKYAGTFLDVIKNPLAIVDRKLKVAWVNPAFYRSFQLSSDTALGAQLGPIGALGDGKLAVAVEGTATTGGPFRDVQVSYKFSGGVTRTVHVSGSRIEPMPSESVLILLTFEADFPVSKGVEA
jgi:two-component system CheB/CheR fusion protein